MQNNTELLRAIRTFRGAKTKAERDSAANEYKRLMAAQEPFTLEHFRRWARGIILDTGEPWELDPFQELFLDDLLSGVKECWLIVPEGNGKTTLIAGVALYHIQYTLTGNVPVAASSRDQAEILFRQAEGLIARTLDHEDPEFSPSFSVGEFKCQEGYRRIKHVGMKSRIQIFAADDRTGDGVIPTFAICDELHRHRDLRLYRTWVGKLDKRGGQLAAISTAGEPGGEFETARTTIRQQSIDVTRDECFIRATSPGMVMHEYAVPAGADCKNFELVKSANPFKGITVEGLREKFQSPTMTLGHWKRFVCNIATRAGNAAITEAEWAAAAVDEGIPEGEPIYLGIDAGWKWDTFALVPFWAPDPSFRLLGPATILVPPRDGTSMDINLVKQAVLDIHEVNPVELVVMDETRAEDVADWIRTEIGADVVDRTQSNKFAVMDYNAWMEALRNDQLHHTGDKGLATHVLNAVTKLLPGGDARFDRPKKAVNTSDQDRRVIDALVAGAMVHAAADAIFRPDEEEEPSSWRPM